MDFISAVARVIQGHFSPEDIEEYDFDLNMVDGLSAYECKKGYEIEYHEDHPPYTIFYYNTLKFASILHVAILIENIEAIEALITHGADPKLICTLNERELKSEGDGEKRYSIFSDRTLALNALELANHLNNTSLVGFLKTTISRVASSEVAATPSAESFRVALREAGFYSPRADLEVGIPEESNLAEESITSPDRSLVFGGRAGRLDLLAIETSVAQEKPGE